MAGREEDFDEEGEERDTRMMSPRKVAKLRVKACLFILLAGRATAPPDRSDDIA